GAIPIIHSLEESLQANRIDKIYGIVNGTTNYILTRMSKEKEEYETVLKDAQRLGLAEPDPAADVEGLDAAYKLSILASLAFHGRVPFEDVYVEGITHINAEDIRCGEELGYTLKLLAIAKRDGLDVETRVHPTFIRSDHPLANVSGSFNAVYLHGHACKEMMFLGRGAGDMPTASAIVSDLERAATTCQHRYPTFANELNPKVALKNNTDWQCPFYIRMKAKDEPGVLSRIAKCFADENVSIAAVQQKGDRQNGSVTLVVITHVASEKAMQRAIGAMDGNIATLKSMIRVEQE
ncbi:MAG: homoserine dehydrogenase, partial [Eubacteriales bacterium]|nr:homoserine dehydrogenase [Eubacteriales bacterium]